MVAASEVRPAHTYANPKRALTEGLKMGAGKNVRVVVSKAADGRYFPVHVGRVQQVDDVTGEELPNNRRRATAQNTRAQRAGARGGNQGGARNARGGNRGGQRADNRGGPRPATSPLDGRTREGRAANARKNARKSAAKKAAPRTRSNGRGQGRSTVH